MTVASEQALALDRAGITVFRDTTSLQPARQVNGVDYEAVGKSTHIR